MAMKFSGGGAGGAVFTFGCALLILIQELFAVLGRQKIALENKLLRLGVHRSRRYTRHTADKNSGRVAEFKRKALETWQRTEILLPALHHLK